MGVLVAVQGLRAGDPREIGGYALQGRLGAGGMGEVFLGLSRGGRRVAVKVVRSQIADEPGFRARFRHEVEAARRVGGFWTAPVVDADPDASPPWVASQYIPALDLGELVARDGTMGEAAVRGLGAALAEALDSIHRAGLLHRDMKPSNVLVTDDGPRVIDFGIAKALEGSTALTRTGTVIGTPGFMSPEQATGEAVGAASDVFSLGAVLAFAATGAGPFGEGTVPALLYRVVHDSPDLTAVPAPLRAVVAACLEKRPERRPKPREVLDLLAPAGSRAVTATPTALDEAAFPPPVPPEQPSTRPGPRPPRPPAAPAAAAAAAPWFPIPTGPVCLVEGKTPPSPRARRSTTSRVAWSAGLALLVVLLFTDFMGFLTLLLLLLPIAAGISVVRKVNKSRKGRASVRVDAGGLLLVRGSDTWYRTWPEVQGVTLRAVGHEPVAVSVAATLPWALAAHVPTAFRPAGYADRAELSLTLSGRPADLKLAALHAALSQQAASAYHADPALVARLPR